VTAERKKQEPAFGLDMGFEEALRRFAGTDPKEVAESIERSKQKRPSGTEPPRRPARAERGKSSSDRNRKP